MSSRCITRRWLCATILVIAALFLHACAALPPTPELAVSATTTRAPASLPSPPSPSATFTSVPSPSATNTLVAIVFPTDTPTPTEPPLAISDPSLGYDCSQVERLPVDSIEAQRLADALVTSYKEKLPTEYIAVEKLWAVERLDDYIVLQMQVTDEAAGIYVLRKTPGGVPPPVYDYLAGFDWGGWPLPSRYTFPEYFTRMLPEAPPDLFYCISQGHYAYQIQGQEELDLRRHYDCALIQSIQADSPVGWAIVHALLDYWSGVVEVATVELDQALSIQQLGPYYAIQVRFLINHRSQPPELFIARQTSQSFEFTAQTGGGGPDRLYLLRNLYSQDPSIPPDLLACLDLYAWLLETPTPTLTPTP